MTNETAFHACLAAAKSIVSAYRAKAVGDPQNKGSVPSPPDPSKAAIAGMREDAANYPFQYAINAAAKMGGVYTDPKTGKTYDFTGLGDASNAEKISDQMAQTILDIQKSSSGAFIAQRLADLKRADPTGYAARQQLFDSIMAEANANPDRPLAREAQNQITGLLNQGAKLGGGPGGQLEEVQQSVRGGQVARGNALGNAAASQEASTVVKAGEEQQAQNQAQAENYLASGVSPEDVQYRRIQQSLSDLGSFVNGTSPTAQFASLSGAQNGAAPFTTSGNPNASFNPNAGSQAMNFQNQMYQSTSNFRNNQVSPWVSGLQFAGGALQTASSLGAFQPAPVYNPQNPNSYNTFQYQSPPVDYSNPGGYG